MRALSKLRGFWRRLTLSLLVLGVAGCSRTVKAHSSRQSLATQAQLVRHGPRLVPRLIRAMPVVPARAASLPPAPKPWLGGSVNALQASLGNDDFWEAGASIEPPTGRRARRIGTALLALGLLRTATSVMHVVFGAPSRCGPGKGLDWSEDSCSNLRLYGYLGMGLSAAFLAGGSIELGRGLMLKRRHDAWKKTHWDHFSSRFVPRGSTVQVAHLRPWSL